MIDENTLTLEGLREFAQTFDDCETMGEAHSSMYCPVAEYVKSLTDEAAVVVVDEARVRVGKQMWILPAEIGMVVDRIDDRHNLGAAVEADSVLEIIDEVGQTL